MLNTIVACICVRSDGDSGATLRVLVVEDEVQLAGIIGQVLEREHYAVDLAYDGLSGLDLALAGGYDAIVLDRMLPGADGLEICRQLRTAGVDTPVLILSARREMPERVDGLDAGADDYLGKPFGFAELLARIRALTRRGDRPILPPVLRAGKVALDTRTHQVVVGDKPIDLSPKEFALLELFLRNRGLILNRNQILDRVWGFDADPEPNIVDLYVHYLRKKLGSRSLIQTVRGAGYVMRED